jgi:hypothetical protein
MKNKITFLDSEKKPKLISKVKAQKSIVFIDFDGVLNNRLSMFKSKKENNTFNGTFSADCVWLFKHLLEQTNSKFVISSVWRRCEGSILKDPKISHAFETNGFENWRDFIYKKAPCTATLDSMVKGKSVMRGKEIKHWIDNVCPGVNYVIIDDDSDMFQKQLSRYVQTEHDQGLTLINIRHAARILGYKIDWNY